MNSSKRIMTSMKLEDETPCKKLKTNPHNVTDDTDYGFLLDDADDFDLNQKISSSKCAMTSMKLEDETPCKKPKTSTSNVTDETDYGFLLDDADDFDLNQKMMSSSKCTMTSLKLEDGTPCKKPKTSPNSATDETDYGFLLDDADEFDMLLASVTSEAKTMRLDLSEWQRCYVVDMERHQRTYALVLTLRSADDSPDDQAGKENTDTALAKCHLQHQWSHTQVKIGDLISVQAVWDEALHAYKVNSDAGLCVTYPDNLISCTSVVGSLFCRRKAVLQDRFKGVDPASKVMIVGSFVHELLQEVLSKGLKEREMIEAAAQQLIHSHEMVHALYSALLTPEEIEHEIEQFVPNIVSFVQQYIMGIAPAVLLKDTFQDTLGEIQDIEENIWVPQLGLKGKVDVSVRIKRRHNNLYHDATASNAIPLELKTGRATFSMEHKGQVILYQMMLSTIGRETRSSLLLYLREGIMRELNGSRNEQRDLIILRNELTHYLTHAPVLPPAGASLALGADKYVQPMKLPEPISHHSACGNCAYATICCTFAQTDAELQLNDGHPLRKVMHEATAHLQPEDFEYFLRWCGLLALEEQEAKKSNYTRALWTEPPESRQENERAILDLQLRDVVVLEKATYMNTFSLSAQMKAEMTDLLLSGFAIGEYVIVSTRTRLAVAAGCIHDLTSSNISISLERDLSKNYAGQTFIIDKHESQSGNIFNYTNIGMLLDNTASAETLRSIVVHRAPSTFHKFLPKVIANEGATILRQLNAVQRSAVLKALTTENYLLIKGLPGTGKTQTLVAIVRLLQLMGKSVLITSHTHSAVDNLLMRLQPFNLPMLRLGAGARINKALQCCAEAHLLKDCHTLHDLQRQYEMYNIVGVTCLGASHALFQHRKFDYCIVDEATQVVQPTTLRPLFFCEKFILVGDPDQLPPLIRSKEARQRGADESLFQRLDTEASTAVLTLQYRMNKTITRLANELTYAGALQCGSKEVELDTLQLGLSAAALHVEKWLQRALQTHIDQAVFLLDTGDCAERSYNFANDKQAKLFASNEQSCADGEDVTVKSSTLALSPTKRKVASRRITKYTNYCDAALILHIVQKLLSGEFAAERIGIVAPYRAQVEMLRKLTTQCHSYYRSRNAALNFAAVEVNTVDQYQGRDKDIILYSCTKSGAVDDAERARETEILEDKRRLTVAITRAKHKLLLVGDARCMQQYTHFRTLLERIPGYCKLQLADGKLDFDWRALLAHLTEISNA